MLRAFVRKKQIPKKDVENAVVEMQNATLKVTTQDVFARTGKKLGLVAVVRCATENREDATNLEEVVFVNMEDLILNVAGVQKIAALTHHAKR